ncbi:glycosyltransferase [Nodularia sp. NIES-3585]|uniref:glycosyltransferase n=1 Tax=Nodularia sp. NIES-3585 TaxID=1973477 RepID=UPI000B5CBE89|nr:glycosyltransferase [Nodularia sp. NIES-3585]GAX34320.1 family 2 glycosyl transferase [Nodularia sp. NIES-3585]
MKIELPLTALVPTRNRSEPLRRMLESLAQQSAQPLEMIVLDGSDDDRTKEICGNFIPGLLTKIHYHQAIKLGAAAQRNQAMDYATQNTIWLLDDDILLEPECLERLWNALHSDPHMGGVNAMITNQKYLPPGRISRLLFQFLHGRYESSYAGKCIGPGMNLLPEDREDLPEVVPVEWLNTTCVLYRREALPHPLFPDIFKGYSLMEDVTLSLTVGRTWKLANARTARIFHDSQPGDHKNNPSVLAEMDLVNRHYVMTQILGRQQWQYYLKLAVLQLFGIVASLTKWQGWVDLPKVLTGKMQAIAQIISTQ